MLVIADCNLDKLNMVSHEEMVRELNEDFEVLLGDMKPYVLQLQLKSERQRCALWIKKVIYLFNYRDQIDGPVKITV